MDPLADSAWSRPETVAGFTTSPPNAVLLAFAAHELQRSHGRRVLDLGCGAGRNAVPLAALGWRVLGTDLSLPMLDAARVRACHAQGRFDVALAPMHAVPVRTGAADLIVAHGIWNLARSAGEFRAAVQEARRAAAPDAALFVFTFSRHTLPANAQPLAGEPFVFTDFSGEPQVFLTEAQLLSELDAVGFRLEAGAVLRELNLPKPGELMPARRPPVIYEGIFRLRG
jgi:SAM-dependent methyltransferase